MMTPIPDTWLEYDVCAEHNVIMSRACSLVDGDIDRASWVCDKCEIDRTTPVESGHSVPLTLATLTHVFTHESTSVAPNRDLSASETHLRALRTLRDEASRVASLLDDEYERVRRDFPDRLAMNTKETS